MRAGVAGCVGRIRCSVWRSTNVSGTSATNIVSDQIGTTQTLSATADLNSQITFSPGVVILNNEYLFFQVQWEETTAGTSNTDTVLFRVGLGSNSVTSSIVTPNFSPSINVSITSPETVRITRALPKVIAWSNTSWSIKGSYPGQNHVFAAIDTNVSCMAVLSFATYIHLSFDGGNTWIQKTIGHSQGFGLAISDNMQYIFVGSGSSGAEQIYVSSDSGSTFTATGPAAGCYQYPFCSNDGSIVYVYEFMKLLEAILL
jgi:hypothetical protein